MTYDLNFMASTVEPAETPLIFDNTVCTGAYKLTQRIIILLFKDTASALLPSLGTDILQLITGNVYQEDDLQNHFNIAADKVRQTIQTTATSTTPEDEQLNSLVIEVTLSDADRSYIILNITVETVSGEAYTSTVPFTLGDR